MNNYRLLGDNTPIVISNNNEIGYPSSDTYSVLGQLYLPRIYGKDLSALEIASSGKIAISLYDEHLFDITKDGGVSFQTTSNNSLSLNSSNVHIQLDGAKQNLNITACNDIKIESGNNITLKAKNVIFEVSGAVSTYGFQVNEFQELILAKNTIDAEGNVSQQYLATFGYNTAARTAAKTGAIL